MQADRRPGGGEVRYPDLWQAVGLLVLALLAVMVVATAVRALGIDDIRAPIVIAAENLLGMGLVIYLGWTRTGAPALAVFPLRALPWRRLAPPMLTLLAGLSLVGSEIDNFMRLLLGNPPGGQDASWLFSSPQAVLQAVILLAVIAPLTEELLFRGLILRGLASRYSPARAIVVSSLLFAVFHLNPWQLGGAFLTGLVFAWWRVRLGHLTPCLLGHAAFNLIPLLAIALLPPIPGFSAPITDTWTAQPALLTIAGVAFTLLGIRWCNEAFNQTFPPARSD